MDSEIVQQQLTITIPYPSYIPRARGIHAVNKFGTRLKATCNQEEVDALRAAAAHIGISQAELIRWACLHVSRAVLGTRYERGSAHVETS